MFVIGELYFFLFASSTFYTLFNLIILISNKHDVLQFLIHFIGLIVMVTDVESRW